jgi:hypothetical protein
MNKLKSLQSMAVHELSIMLSRSNWTIGGRERLSDLTQLTRLSTVSAKGILTAA